MIIEPVILKKEEGGATAPNIPRHTENLGSYSMSGSTQYYAKSGTLNLSVPKNIIRDFLTNYPDGVYDIGIIASYNSGNYSNGFCASKEGVYRAYKENGTITTITTTTALSSMYVKLTSSSGSTTMSFTLVYGESYITKVE